MEQIWCVLSEEMLAKTKKKMAKIQKLKCHNSLNNFGRDPPQEYAWFLGVNLMRTFREYIVSIFSQMWSFVNENEKKKKKKM